jgi:hypothetical protein
MLRSSVSSRCGKQRKLPHGTANIEQEHELLEYALTSRPSCGTLDMQGTNRIYLMESGIGPFGSGELKTLTAVLILVM